MKVNRNISSKTWTIIILIIIISLILLVPFEKLQPAIIGAVVSKVFVYGMSINATCNISLVEGWNLISTPCLGSNSSLLAVLSPIEGNYISIHAYNESDTKDPWKSYNPNLPTQVVQDLSDISREKGYWINMEANYSLFINGTRIWPAFISLEEGWNLVGYTNNNTKNTTNVLSSISGAYTIIWAYNASDASYVFYNPSLGTGTLTEIKPYWGYWINMSSDANWRIT